MEFELFTTGKEDEGRRLDKVIRIFLSNQRALSKIYSAIRKGEILVNNKKSSPEYRIVSNDKILISKTLLQGKEEKVFEKDLSTFPYKIIFQSKDLLVLNKDYDISVQEDIAPLVKKYFQKDLSLAFTPAPLHRLDKKTTGVLLCSLSNKASLFFSDCFKNEKLEKHYIALVKGKLKNKIYMENYIEKSACKKNGFYTMKVSDKTLPSTLETSTLEKLSLEASPSCKKALGTMSPLANAKYNGFDVSLVHFMIKTGRKHQIRVQSSFYGFPLLGDTAYGSPSINERQDFFLHAH
ncbi:MAG: RluA family pseudouridine synthase, partial [Treponema sp.]|nr:RluA family pseudouridine synthase [Treponema sp.]